MDSPTRMLGVLPVILALAWLSSLAIDAARVELALMRASRALDDFGESDAARGALRTAEQELIQSRSRQPQNPTVHELLAVAAKRMQAAGSSMGAEEHLLFALAMRPVSPYTWAALAEARYRSGDTGPVFEEALVRAVELGIHEPAVQRTVAFFGLPVWNHLHTTSRQAVDRAVRAGVRRAPSEMLQIGMRRGRLEIVCRHLAGAPRHTDAMWRERCKSTEAT